MSNKKAFEMQFNWIFVLIAGAAILLFFTLVVAKQKSVSETSTKTTVLKNMEAIITGASITTDTTKLESLPNSQIEIGCNRISASGVSKQYQNLIVFSPDEINVNKLVWQTMAFSIPYRATNLLFITSAKIRYIIISNPNNNLAKEISKQLPAALMKEAYDTGADIPYKNADRVKFIFVGVNQDTSYLDNLQEMRDSDVTAIKISNTGHFVEFYQKKGNLWISLGTTAYAEKSSMIGAVYSGSIENYQCSMKNLFLRLKLVSDIYKRRTNQLMSTNSVQECKDSYNRALLLLNTIISKSSTLAKAPSFLESDITVILNSANFLAEENKALQRLSCPVIY